MENNNKKIWDIANDDLTFISLFFEKIKSTAISTYSYLSNVIAESDERINRVLYMLDVIEDLANMADDQLSAAIEKLCAIYRETKEKEAAK